RLPTPSMFGPSSSHAGSAGREESRNSSPLSKFLLDLFVSRYSGWLCHVAFREQKRPVPEPASAFSASPVLPRTRADRRAAVSGGHGGRNRCCVDLAHALPVRRWRVR